MAFKMPQGYEEYFKDWEDRIGAFIEFSPDRSPHIPAGTARSALEGLPFAVKDNIALEGFSFSCASKLLEGLKAPYTATAVRRLLEAGCVPVGTTNMDEFAMGASTDASALKRTNNPWDTERIAGGSSGGSAAAVAAGLVPFALGSDTGGSVRLPAAMCGVLGLKPSYGAVSRYGLAAVASSLEGIGILSDTVLRCRQVFDVIRGADSRDETSCDVPSYDTAKKKSSVIGVLSHEALAKSMAAAALEPEVSRGFDKARENLAALGYTMKEIEFPCLKYSYSAYQCIVNAEASSNLARFDGIRFGRRPDWAENPDDLVDKSRDYIGDDAALRILAGTHVLRSGNIKEYYHRALQIRSGIMRNFMALLGKGDGAGDLDALLFPVCAVKAYRRGTSPSSVKRQMGLYTSCANLAGLPGLSLPASVEGGLPVGIQLIGRAFEENTLLDIAEKYEKAHPFPHPPGHKEFWSRP